MSSYVLQMEQVSSLTALPASLPPNLRNLKLKETVRHVPLPRLPETLESLELNRTAADRLPELPSGLKVCNLA